MIEFATAKEEELYMASNPHYVMLGDAFNRQIRRTYDHEEYRINQEQHGRIGFTEVRWMWRGDEECLTVSTIFLGVSPRFETIVIGADDFGVKTDSYSQAVAAHALGVEFAQVMSRWRRWQETAPVVGMCFLWCKILFQGHNPARSARMLKAVKEENLCAYIDARGQA